MAHRTVLFLSSAAAHAAAIAALIAAGAWRVAKLPAESTPPVYLAMAVPPALPAPGGGDGKPPPLRRAHGGAGRADPARKQRAAGVQPLAVEEDAATAAGGRDADGDVWGDDAWGVAGGDGRGLHIVPGTCRNPPCGVAGITEVAVPDPPEPRDRIVPPELLRGRRIAGSDRIEPPDAVRVAMARAGVDRVRASVRLCIDSRGRVRDLAVLRSTTYPAYDATLIRAMRAWRYRPYEIDGTPVPACTVVQVLYRFR